MDERVQRSVMAVKARAVTGEARRRAFSVVFYAGWLLAVCDDRAASGAVERRKRSQGDDDDGGWI